MDTNDGRKLIAWRLDPGTIFSILTFIVLVSMAWGGNDQRVIATEREYLDLKIVVRELNVAMIENTKAIIRLETRLEIQTRDAAALATVQQQQQLLQPPLPLPRGAPRPN